ncbi:MAG: ATP-binding cassette domain-containing protein [Acetobacteraceae bacterium]|nr:ATP-binding cassette domain-containing protein [Acetobacteraceae bacterium]
MIRNHGLTSTIYGGLALALVLSVFVDGAILVIPIYDMQLYDRVLMSRNFDTLTMLSVACAVGLLFYGVIDFLRSTCFLAIAQDVGGRLEGPALAHGLRRAAQGDRSAGPLLARDVEEVRSLLGSGKVATPLDAMCTPLFIAVLFMLHPAFGFLAIGGVAGLILANAVAEWLVGPKLQSAQAARQAADHALSRSLAEADLTEGLGMLPAIAGRWCDRYAVAVRQLGLVASRAHAVATFSRLFRLLLQAAVMAIGAILIIQGQTTPGSLMGANLLLSKCLGPFDHLVESCQSWRKARDAWRRLCLVPPIADFSAQPSLPEPAPTLVVDGVTFASPDGRTILEDVSFRLEPGTFALLSGPNGGGKTTLMRLLAGVLAPGTGSIRLGEQPVHDHPEIGYLPQSVSLLDGSIAENVGRFGGDLAAVVQAARRARIHELVGRMTRGYDTCLSHNGSPLSGGMRQRVGLARALYGSPRLLLLDEPDANLDGEGAASLLAAIRQCCADGTIAVVISHRRAMLEAADLVITVKAGRTVLDARKDQAIVSQPRLRRDLVTA